MRNKTGFVDLFVAVGILVCLVQAWLPHYFLTGDGPCHAANARIVNDLWQGHSTAFYERFYKLSYQPNPNWFSTFVMAMLIFLFNAVVAEKILISLYIILFVTGFLALLKSVTNAAGVTWPLCIFVFVFPHTLAEGFYNFSFGIAFYLWLVWSWLRFLTDRTYANGLLFLLFTALLYFTHLMPFVFGMVTCAALIWSFVFSARFGSGNRLMLIAKYCGILLLFALPFVLLAAWFTGSEGGLQFHMANYFSLLKVKHLVEFVYIVNVTGKESVYAMSAGILLIILLGISMLRFRKGFYVHPYDGLLLTFLFLLLFYLFSPEDLMGRTMLLTRRVQPLVYMTGACCIAYMLQSTTWKNLGGAMLFACFLGLTLARIPCRQQAAEGVDDIMSAATLIKPNSVVLPLNFAPNGKLPSGKLISDRCAFFGHAVQYLGASRPLIILDNFEAVYGYFPLEWKDITNPYEKLYKEEGIEGVPPYAEIGDYRRTAGVRIDYILMWCYDSVYLRNRHFASLYGEISSGYHNIYQSPSGRTRLYLANSDLK